jgi:hypothetical protein
MSKKLADLSQINEELKGALSLLEERLGDFPMKDSSHGNIVQETASLLQRCADIVDNKQSEKPLIRVLHHFACSGGTLISKCLSSMPNTYLLSEVHPTTHLNVGNNPEFRPTDVISLCRYARLPNIDELSREILVSSVQRVTEFLSKIGSKLIIREHTHSDYCVGAKETGYSEVVKSLSHSFTIKSVVTVRDPIDSYLSLKNNGWAHFSPNSFEEYCRRYVTFLNNYDDAQVFKYETFVENPSDQMKLICEYLEIEFVESFLDFFDTAVVTGDSGRKSSNISKRARREVSNEMQEEIIKSPSYRTIADRFHYEL